MQKYVIGLDFGTLSGRAIVVSVENGEILSNCVKDYPHGVLQDYLPDGKTRLMRDWCLQIPGDYIDVMLDIIPKAIAQSGVSAEDIIALAIDCTASTLLPVDAQYKPLCEKEGFESRPHAYVKLWKHHGAQAEANEINEKLDKFPNDVQKYYGERISSEIVLPKVLQIIHEDPEIYEAASAILEVPDWLNRMLTGEVKQSISTAGYKAMYFNEKGYPDKEFLRNIDPALEGFVEEKLGGPVCEIDKPFGKLNAEWAAKLGLNPGIAVGCSIIDAHACMIGCGITQPRRMMLVLGTSSVQTVLADRTHSGEGIIGTIKDCIVPGYYAWETGLAAVGDQLAWFAQNCAAVEGANVSEKLVKLTELAGELKPGECGMLALDWWNGNKTPFVQGGLSGVMLGMKLDTSPAMLFRAMIESTAFGTRRIMESFTEAGGDVDEIVACGGIAEKNATLMQIFADVLGRKIYIAGCKQTGAMGAAIIAATAAGSAAGGYDTMDEAAAHMTRILPDPYVPNPAHTAVYDQIYSEYKALSDYLGKYSLPAFEKLNRLRNDCLINKEE